jgi:hypothetical protein
MNIPATTPCALWGFAALHHNRTIQRSEGPPHPRPHDPPARPSRCATCRCPGRRSGPLAPGLPRVPTAPENIGLSPPPSREISQPLTRLPPRHRGTRRNMGPASQTSRSPDVAGAPTGRVAADISWPRPRELELTCPPATASNAHWSAGPAGTWPTCLWQRLGVYVYRPRRFGFVVLSQTGI